MRLGLYPRLALDGIRKNKRMYFPYLLTCIGMVMMTYIIHYLKYADAVASISGGETVQTMMNAGAFVMTFFSAIFLFYTNSFLIRRRKKEFGLYHILGMGKGNVSKILAWETVFVAVASLALGLAGGIAISKLAELGLVNLLRGDVTYTLSVSADGVFQTAVPFVVIFLLLLLNSLRQIRFSSAISLLKSESAGERPPRANWALGILGVVLLGIAYYMAVTIQDPVSAIFTFMAAVMLVIAATYLVMIAGSVLLCRILQGRKGYYYKPNHFVSVSSMAYRMKRNGAGLASICILATMVLVMLSSTTALFLGSEDVIRSRYPREMNLWFSTPGNEDTAQEDIAQGDITQEDRELFIATVDDALKRHDAAMGNLLSYRTVAVAGLVSEGEVYFDQAAFGDFDLDTFADVHQIYLVPIEDYNSVTGSEIELAEDEVLVYASRTKFDSDTFGFVGLGQYRVKEHLTDSFLTSDMAADIVPPLMVVVPDLAVAAEGLEDSDGNDLTYKKWYYCFDTSLDGEEDIALWEELKEDFRDLQLNGHDTFTYRIESREYERQDFYAIYGGLFFLGILLSIVFLFAAVLIIYYKQISEGYEDQARFEIMQKVGMTKREIKRSVNSQILTVFFLPLAGAGLHLAFAFPIIEKLLLLFNLSNHWLFVGTAAFSFLVFALFYVIVYRVTSNAYYQIVSS